MSWQPSLGAIYLGSGRCRFRVWAPFKERIEVHLLGQHDRTAPLTKEEWGYHSAVVEGVSPGDRYVYRIDGGAGRPDPASRWQPEGVHGPSVVVAPVFNWQDEDWRGIALKDYIIYELHVGTYTPEGTFDAIIPHIGRLKDFGITALEIMPVAQFPGERNWGYDGVDLFAAQHCYGGPAGLKGLVDACHRQGMAVVLDVVYNHIGPEGNYLGEYGPYFTDKYRTPWGSALNFDGPHSDQVRAFFLENALSWITDYHIDSLRLDAIHAIIDHTPRPFLEELADAVREQAKALNRQIYTMPETSANNARYVRPKELGGHGLDAQWNDEFYHSLHTLLTPDNTGYYADYGRLENMSKAFREGYVYSGQYSAYRQRRHGVSSKDLPAAKFIVFTQNHDQVGNRAQSDRHSTQLSFDALKLAAGAVLLSPFIPLLFMGEEYGEPAPFCYFVSHGDPALIEAVRNGRKAEFTAFAWRGEPPDPQAEETFLRSKLDHSLREQGEHKALYEYYRELIRLRKTLPVLVNLSKEDLDVVAYPDHNVLAVRRWYYDEEAWLLLNFRDSSQTVSVPLSEGNWTKTLDSADKRWGGPGSHFPESPVPITSRDFTLEPHSCVLLTKKDD